jgi:surface antigen
MKQAILVALLTLCLGFVSAVVLAEENIELGGAEQQAMADTLQHALEENPTNQSSAWVNPDTGRSGTSVPIKTFQNSSGQPCREFISTITIAGREEQGYGTACRQPDGSWQLAADAEPAGSVQKSPPRTEVYSYQPPANYYVYPSGFYGPNRIYLSFDYVFRGGRLHYGSRYLDGPTFRQRYYHPVKERVYIGPRFIDRYRVRDEWRYRDWERKHEWKDNRGRYRKDQHQDRGRGRNDWDDRGRRGKHRGN